MTAYRVTHRESGARYYLLADSAEHAIETVCLRLADAGGRDGWNADAETPSYGLSKNVILDDAGKPVHNVEG